MAKLRSGWAGIQLGAIARPSRPRVSPIDLPKLPYVGMEHVESNTGRLLGTVPAASMKSTAFNFRAGDVLYGRLRPYLNKVHLAEFEGLCSSEFIVLAPTEAINPKFLAYRLRHPGFVEFANQQNQGDRPRVSFDQIAPFKIALPPKKEQARIVAKLDALLGDVAITQKRLERVPKILKRFRQAVLMAATAGTLSGDWRKKKGLPEWKWASLGELDLTIQTGPFGSALHKHDYVVGGVPIVNPMHIRDGKILPSPEFSVSSKKARELSGYLLRKGDVVLGRRGEMGRAAVVEKDGLMCGTGSLFIRSENINPQFLCIVLRSPQIVGYLNESSVGTTMTNLNHRIIEGAEFPVVEKSEQEEVVHRVEAFFDLADRIESRYASIMGSIAQISQAILAKGIRGELLSQNPDDESADALLERLRIELPETAKL